MATVSSITFETDKDSLFATAIQVIQGAGYIISETDDAARKIVYVADSGGGFQNKERYEVTITVSGASQTAIATATAVTALFNIKAICITNKSNNTLLYHTRQIIKFENELINFVSDELRKQFQVVATTTPTTNAPGAGGQKAGCLVVLGYLGLLAAGCGLGCLVLLATLFP